VINDVEIVPKKNVMEKLILLYQWWET